MGIMDIPSAPNYRESRDDKKMRKLREAMNTSVDDPVAYYNACIDAGFDQYDAALPDVFLQGAALAGAVSSGRTLERSEGRNSRYAELIRITENQGLRVDDIGADIGQKSENLVRVWPGRFSEDGRQPLSQYVGQPAKIGALYKNLHREAHRKTKNSR